jgi:hypothetical protein
MTTIEYDLPNPAEVGRKSDREILQAIIDGQFPGAPVSQALPFQFAEVGEGFVAVTGAK